MAADSSLKCWRAHRALSLTHSLLGNHAGNSAGQSIRRAYTPEEFRALIVEGTRGNFRHTVAPFWIRQMADVRY
jgi:hypothetical protein